jgi:hypothetical protein
MARKAALAISAFLYGWHPMEAAAQSIGFDGSVESSCTIMVASGGVLALDLQSPNSMRTWVAGGSRAIVNLIVTGTGFKVGLTRPTGFTQTPAGYDLGAINFTSTYNLYQGGAAIINNVDYNVETPLSTGNFEVRINLTATRTDLKPFPAGDYSTESTISCYE